MEGSYDQQVKVLMLGSSGDGKTTLLLTYMFGEYRPQSMTTVGPDFKIKLLEVENKKIKLQVWDYGGAYRFRGIAESHYRSADGILLVYDVTQRDSFNEITNYFMPSIERLRKDNVPPVLLLGTKCDMNNCRSVSWEEGKALADSYGLQFFEVSAKDNINVNDAFQTLTEEIVCKNT